MKAVAAKKVSQVTRFRPMLAPRDDPKSKPDFFESLPWPLLCSIKYDGIRGVSADKVYSRTWKPFRSYQVQEEFSQLCFLDGEFIADAPNAPNVCRHTDSHMMSFNKPGNLAFYVFDHAHPDIHNQPFERRLESARQEVLKLNRPDIIYVEHVLCEDLASMLAFEEKVLGMGYEGIMMRTPYGVYKSHARCTWLDHIIFKLKRFTDGEALVVDLEEGTDNQNEQERDERGYAKRSKAAAGLVPAGRVGRFIVETDQGRFPVAPGSFTKVELGDFWKHPEKAIGRWLKYRHFEKGVKDLPRFARAITFRDPIDM